MYYWDVPYYAGVVGWVYCVRSAYYRFSFFTDFNSLKISVFSPELWVSPTDLDSFISGRITDE